MNFTDYQKKAIDTKIYDDQIALPYIVLGLVGEASEVVEKIKGDKRMVTDVAGVRKELGDVAWYIAAFADELDIDILSIKPKLSQNPSNDIDFKLELFDQVGQASEITKKILRDNLHYIQGEDETSEIAFDIPKDKEEALIQIVRNLLALVSIGAINFGNTSLSNILEINIEKLQSRKERDQLKGSGDDR